VSQVFFLHDEDFELGILAFVVARQILVADIDRVEPWPEAVTIRVDWGPLLS